MNTYGLSCKKETRHINPKKKKEKLKIIEK